MIAIGCDHGGFELKNAIAAHFDAIGVQYKDFGAFSAESVDYATVAAPLAKEVVAGVYDKGILCCGTGIGMSMAANKVKGIRAAACSDKFSAEFTRRHNDANILCIGGRVVSNELGIELCDIFLNTPFEGGRHERRIKQIADIENGEL